MKPASAASLATWGLKLINDKINIHYPSMLESLVEKFDRTSLQPTNPNYIKKRGGVNATIL